MAKKRNKKKQRFTFKPWMIVALIAIVIVVIFGVITASQRDDDGDNGDDAAATFTTISVQEAYDQTQANPDAVLVDVRQPNEWEDFGYPAGAALLEMDDILAIVSGPVEGLPQDQPVYVICNSGNRSVIVADHLIGLGYEEVYNVDGGIEAWLDADLPTDEYTP